MISNWKMVKLGDVCRIIGGGTPAKNNVDYYKGNIPWATVRDMKNFNLSETEFCITPKAVEESATNVIPKGTIVISTHVGLGKICELMQDTAINQDLKALFLDDMVDKHYFSYWYQSIANYIVANGTGATVKGVKIPFIQGLEMPLPPIQEQKQIVEKLDNAFAKIDAIKANAEKSVNEAQNLYKSVLEDLTKPCDTWSNNTLGDVVDFVRGPFGGSLTKNMFIESGYAVYEQQHAIHEHLLFRYFVDEKKYKEMERFQVHSGDLIMSCSGVIGRVVIIPENAPRGIINQALLKMSIRKGLINEYLCYLLKSPSFQKTIFEHTKGAAIPNLAPVATIKRIQVYLPSLEEQRLIVNKLDKISESIQRLKNTIEIVQSECSALKQSILRKAFNGEL